MYTVTKRLEVSASHHLVLDYASKCENLHGHNWHCVRAEVQESEGNVAVYEV